MNTYRQHFRPGRLEKPHVAVAVQIFCAENTEEASEMTQKYCLSVMHRNQEAREKGISSAKLHYPSVQEVASYSYVEQDRAYLHKDAFPIIAGDPFQLKEQLEKIAEFYGADELIVSAIFPDVHARLRSYELLAGAFQSIPAPSVVSRSM